MIDFRFFVISIAAVFLALGLGIMIGSGFLRDIDSRLESRVEDVVEREQDLRSQILELEDVRDTQREFLELVQPRVVDGLLFGEQVVMVEIEGTDAELVEGVSQVIEDADGITVLELRFNNRLRLDDEQAVGELAATLESISTNPTELRSQLGREMGARLSDAAVAPPRLDGNRDRSQMRARELLAALEEDGFISFAGEGIADLPQGARFVFATGAATEPTWPAQEVVEPMGFALASETELGVVVAETSDSQWGIAEDVRNDAETSDVVSTIDNAESVPGRITVTLGLSLAPETIGHWGDDESATAPAPTPPG